MNSATKNIAKNTFVFIGLILSAVITILLFLFRLWAKTNDSVDDLDTSEDKFDDLFSMSPESTVNPMNANNIYDD